jgi:hypothetical protein
VSTYRLLVATFCISIFGALAARPVAAQSASSLQTSSSLKAWNAADEIIFGAAVREVVSKNPAGAPAGVNLLMSGSQETLYVSVGPYLTDQVKRSLTTGQMVQTVGMVQTINGQNYLMARQLIIGGQTIEVRNSHGFLIHPSTGSRSSAARPQGLLGGTR